MNASPSHAVPAKGRHANRVVGSVGLVIGLVILLSAQSLALMKGVIPMMLFAMQASMKAALFPLLSCRHDILPAWADEAYSDLLLTTGRSPTRTQATLPLVSSAGETLARQRDALTFHGIWR